MHHLVLCLAKCLAGNVSARKQSGAALFPQRVAQRSALQSALSKPSTAVHADQSVPAKVPRPHEALVDPDSSDSDAEGAAAGAESADIVALKAKIKELEAAKITAAATAEAALLKARARTTKYKTANKELRKKHQSVNSSPDSDASGHSGVIAELAQLVKARKALVKSAEPRRPKPLNGEGEQDLAAGVRRFVNALQLFFQLSNLAPELWAANARLYLEGSPADYMQTALKSLPAAESTDWTNFCTLLSTRFGQIDPDAEFWAQLENLKQGSLTAVQYVHKMRYCFNGITVLPLSNGEKIHRFMTGLNPRVKEKVVTAPYGMGDGSGKWLDPDQLMQYTVMQAQVLLNGGAVSAAAAASSPSSIGQKRSSDGGNAGGNGQRKKLKKNSAGNGQKKPNGKGGSALNRSLAEREWLSANNYCWHCCEKGHASYNCVAKGEGKPPAPDMPAGYKAKKAVQKAAKA